MSEQPKLLIIDDDRKIAHAVAVRAGAAGYQVRSAHDGQAGLAAATQENFNAIVLDLRLPKLDGFAVMAALGNQATTRHIPVVVLSASAVDESRALDAGAFCFLAKPYDPRTLLTTIAAAVLRPCAGHA